MPFRPGADAATFAGIARLILSRMTRQSAGQSSVTLLHVADRTQILTACRSHARMRPRSAMSVIREQLVEYAAAVAECS
jgi:hypothetical protein